MQKPSVTEFPSSRVPEKAPRWDLTGREGCGGGKVFSWMLLVVWEYICEYIGERIRSGESHGPTRQGVRPTPQANPPPLWPPRGSSDLISKSLGCLLVEEKSSRRFYSVWTPFGIPFLRNSKLKIHSQIKFSLQNHIVWLCSIFITQNIQIMHNPGFSEAIVS